MRRGRPRAWVFEVGLQVLGAHVDVGHRGGQRGWREELLGVRLKEFPPLLLQVEQHFPWHGRLLGHLVVAVHCRRLVLAQRVLIHCPLKDLGGAHAGKMLMYSLLVHAAQLFCVVGQGVAEGVVAGVSVQAGCCGKTGVGCAYRGRREPVTCIVFC